MENNSDHEDNSGDETLEEGRVALHLLERQLKINTVQPQDDVSEGSSRHGSRQSLMAERRLLDQQPRDTRLLLRKGSPLGLTLEELDDRGLLEGGGVVPSYYTSLKQKNRRQLELQDRSSRLRQRGNEDTLKFKVSSNILRMIRVLVQKGLNLEEMFRVGTGSLGTGEAGSATGSEGGMMDKDTFLTILRKLDLPFTIKDLIVFSNRYAISSLQIDYELFLNDIQRGVDGDDSIGGNSSANHTSTPTPRFHLVHDLKTMLLESKDILKKSYDEIYRMFSRWDNYGTGTVTITQFFRVLSQLHINFTDQDQDFLVDLLDNDGQGKVDFEGLLAFCFVSDVELSQIPTHVTASTVNDHNDECVSASGSTGNGTATSSRNMNPVKRPHTASAFRGQTYTSDTFPGDKLFAEDTDLSANYVVQAGQDSQLMHPVNSPVNRRPLTASGRVLNGEYRANPKSSENKHPRNHSRPQSARLSHDDSHFILEITSDNEGEDSFPVPDIRPFDRNQMPEIKGAQPQLSQQPLISPVSHEKSHKTSSSLTTLGQSSLEISASSLLSPQFPSASYPAPSHPAPLLPASSQQFQPSQPPLFQQNPPQRPHSAGININAAKSNLRSAISVYLRKSGLSIHEVFNLFDNKNVRFFGAPELIDTCRQYFNLNLPPSIASSLVSSIAVGGYDRISYSDLLVFVVDPLYHELEDKLLNQISEQLEHQGREYQYLLYSVLSQENSSNSNNHLSHSNSSGIVSVDSFRNSLNKLGFQLTPDEVDRIISKFDTHGSGKCSVSRFMSMVQNNSRWKFTLDTIGYHEEAIEECQIVRQRMNSSSRHAVTYNYSNELIDMCEYLGIRILSEPELLWIVEEAVNAPLPDGWTVHQNQEGKTYFYNHKQSVTRWDHPLDPYFRKLRDENRKRNSEITTELSRSEVTGKALSLNEGINSQHEGNSQTNTEYFQKDQSIDIGGPDEEDIRDDMSDYYKMSRHHRSKMGSATHHKQNVGSNSASQPSSHVPEKKSNLISSHSSPDVARFSRPLSAPGDRHHSSEHFVSAQSNRNDKVDINRQQGNILLPGGTYVDTGHSRVGGTKTNAKASNSASRITHQSQKRMPQGVSYNINGKKEKPRPSSTTRVRANPPSNLLKTNDSHRALTRMFNDDIIDDLDVIMKYPKTNQQTNINRPTDPRLLISTKSGGNRVSDYDTYSQQKRGSDKIKTKDSDHTIWL